MRKTILLAATALVAFTPLAAQDVPAPQIPANFSFPEIERDYDKRVVMMPMRDGTKLYTVIVVPKGAKNAPIVLTRTPYNAKGRAQRADSPKMRDTLPLSDEIFVDRGYIRVFQDVRGKYGSEGDYVVNRPVMGPYNDTGNDHVTDAYDTIDWLVNKANLPESNGKVGMIGSSYEGFTVVAALLNPHPALKAAVPESPMVDGWMGDDWFHYGAFRMANIGWIGGQTGYKGRGDIPSTGGWDDYDNFRKAGSAGEWAKKSGFDKLPFWNYMVKHHAYDGFWQAQALDKLVAANPSNVPTIWEQGLWDHEDMYGAVMSWEALKKVGKMGNNHLVMGPWRHSQINRVGRNLGPFEWNGDTAAQFREEMVLPLFKQYLEDGPAANLPAAAIYNTGLNHWDKMTTWPLACDDGCTTPLKPIFLQADGGLGFNAGAAGGDSYVSDPANPVPHLPRPVNFRDGRWGDYLVTDQRFVDGRPDVLTYQSEVLTEPVRVSGAPIAEIFAKTTGTDGDFIVKVIDVLVDPNVADPKMGGYQWPISMDIFRGRYRKSFSEPSAIPANQVEKYKFRLPTVNHVFKPGHRIMIQIQSSQFPAYDRNPQKFVPNIFLAKREDYQKATITIMRGGPNGSRVLLPVVPVDQSAVMQKK